jgi:putative ABC transport system substrate-binding protein
VIERRRDFIALAGGAVVPFIAPRPARGQGDRLRRIGVLNSFAETDTEAQAWDAAFRKRLDELGWINGRNLRIDYRWGAGSVDRLQPLAHDLVRLNPDALLAVTTPATAALQRETHSIPIVFAIVSDPIGSGFVASLANPGGNITGFIDIEGSLPGKWLDLLREIRPGIARAAFMFNPQTTPYARYYLDTFQSAASASAIEPIEAPIRSGADVESVMTALAREGGAGLIVMPDTSMATHRQTIYALSDRYRLPTVYPFRFFATEGGLISYGIVLADLVRRAASYVDRILRGAKPAELPVELPTKFELVINLKTARSLGLSIPDKLLTLADEVIE